MPTALIKVKVKAMGVEAKEKIELVHFLIMSTVYKIILNYLSNNNCTL